MLIYKIGVYQKCMKMSGRKTWLWKNSVHKFNSGDWENVNCQRMISVGPLHRKESVPCKYSQQTLGHISWCFFFL